MSYRLPIVVAAVIGLGFGLWQGLSGPDGKTVQAQQEVPSEPANKVALSAASDPEKEGPEQQLTRVERQVPTFELSTLDNTPWSLDTLKGKPWVINFWATWCPPCIEEIPSMNAAYAALEPQGIGMLAINAGEGAEAVEDFFTRIVIDFPNVLGNSDTLSNWSVKALPTTIVVDAEGRVVFEALGPREWDDERLLQNVVDLL